MAKPQRSQAVLRQLPKQQAVQRTSSSYPLSLTSITILGRDPYCQIAIDPAVYRSVSRRHAEVRPVPEQDSSDAAIAWQVRDLDSSNGTYVNDKRIEGSEVLQAGDRIMLGWDGPQFVFEYQPQTNPFEPNRTPSVNEPGLQPDETAAVGLSPQDRVTVSQLFPILSTGGELPHKAHLLPGMITIAFVVSLFLAVGYPILLNLLLAAYLSGAAYFFVYRLCGKRKPWPVLLGTAIATVLLLLSPGLNLFLVVFRQWLPGEIPTDESAVNLITLAVKMFFGAGLMEELLKALPVLALAWLGAYLKSPWRRRIGVREPLDGILLGAASAVGFTLVETLGQYIPEIYNSVLASSNEQAAQLASLQLLIPRVLGLVAGHMAYSGYLGYFIGLSVLRPRKRWLILGVGYLSASGLHTLWNISGIISPLMLAVVGIVSYAFLGAAILKARVLSPTRSQNFATRFHPPQ